MTQLTTFGGPVLLDAEGNPVEPILAQPRRLALLTYLALETRKKPVRRDIVLAMFWPEVSQARASRSLSQAMHFLRNALGHDVFGKPGRDDIQVNFSVLHCDACEFLTASESGRCGDAARIYTGDFLRGFYVGDAAEFEEWAEQQRLHLRRVACECALSEARAAAAKGHALAAASYARRAAELGLFAEPLVREQMELLDSVGDSAGALEAFETLRRRLRRDLDGEPSPETAALAERLRSRASVARPVISGVTLPPQEAARPIVSPVTPPRRHKRQSMMAAAGGLVAFTMTLSLWGLRRVDPRQAEHAQVILIDDFMEVGHPADGAGKELTDRVIRKLTNVPGLSAKYIAAAPLEVAARRGPDAIVLRGNVSETPWQKKPRVTVTLVNGMSGDAIVSREFAHDDMAALLSDQSIRDIADYVRTEAGRYGRAKRIADFSPKNAEIIHQAAAYRTRGDSLRGDGEAEQALAAFDAADSLLTGITEGRRAAAMALAERADIWYSRAWVFLTPQAIDLGAFQRNATRAVELADSAIALDAQSAAAQEVRGFALHLLWQTASVNSVASMQRFLDMSEEAARTAVSIAPARARAWTLLSTIYFVQGRYDRALNSAQRAYTADAFLEESPEVLNRMFSSSVETGDMQRAAVWCQELGRRYPGSWLEADCRLQLLAWSTPSLAQFDEATQLVAKQTARPTHMDPLAIRLEMMLGIVAARAGLPIDSALAIQNEAIANAPDNPELAPERAWLWRTLNRPDSLRAVLNAYISADPIRRSGLRQSRRFRIDAAVIADNQGLQYKMPLIK